MSRSSIIGLRSSDSFRAPRPGGANPPARWICPLLPRHPPQTDARPPSRVPGGRPSPKSRERATARAATGSPIRGVDRVLVGMMAGLRDLRRDVVDRDDAVEQHHDHENQEKQREIVEKRIAHGCNVLARRETAKISRGIIMIESRPTERQSRLYFAFVNYARLSKVTPIERCGRLGR